MVTQLAQKIISIHAPTRGATMPYYYDFNEDVFQSTLLQEERHKLLRHTPKNRQFQSTLLQEERREILKLTPDYYDFNPRSYKRSDKMRKGTAVVCLEFQSTLLQEERRYANDFFSIKRQFQSTLLQEERHMKPLPER